MNPLQSSWDALRLQKGIITVEQYIERNPNSLTTKLLKEKLELDRAKEEN